MDHNHHGHHSPQPTGGEEHQYQHTGMQEAHKPEHKMADQRGHDEHAGHHTEDFLKRFWICLVITVPILLLSHMVQQWAGFTLSFTGDKYVLLALSTFVYIYGGGPFLKGLVRELKHRLPGMMTLVAVAITAAWVYSTGVVFGLAGMDFFWELATLIDIMLLGHRLEMR